jgi:drug/metabolite transporter (DMT)-like permease
VRDTQRSAASGAQPRLGLLLLAFGFLYLMWGSTYLAIRVAIESFPPLLMVGSRYVIAGGALYLWSRWRGDSRPTRPNWRSALVAGALLFLGGNGSLAWAEQRVPSGLAALLIATTPLWMVLILWWTKGERPGAAVWAGLGLGLLGLGVMIGPIRGNGSGAVDPLGAAMLVFASVSWAAGALYARDADLPRSTVQSTGVQMLAGGVLMVLFGLGMGEGSRLHLLQASLRSWLGWGFLIIGGGIIGFTAFSWLMRVASPARVSTYAYVNPVVAVFLGWAILGEPLTGRILLAAAIIVSGVVLVITFRGRGTGVPAKALAPVPGQKSDSASLPAAVACDEDAG